MSYRIAKLTHPYQFLVDHFYERNPQLAGASSSRQIQCMQEQGLFQVDFARHFAEFGVDLIDIIICSTPLINALGKETGLPTNSSRATILNTWLKTYRPDVLYMDDGLALGEEAHEILSDLNIPVQFVRCCFPYQPNTLEWYRNMDFVLTCSPVFAREMTRHGLKVYSQAHGFEAHWLPKLDQDNPYPVTDLSFSGSFFAVDACHNERIRLFTRVARTPGLDLKIYSSTLPRRERPPGVPPSEKDLLIEALGDRIYPAVYGLDMLKVCRKSRIGLNCHGGVAQGITANIRMFEVPGVGSCLLTDHTEDVRKYYEPDSEILTYRSHDEAIEKINWLMEHPKEREKLASSGQKRTLKEHLCIHRAMELNEHLTNLLHNKKGHLEPGIH